MSWQDEIREIERRRAAAQRLGGEEAVRRQHEEGRLTIRERIDAIVDRGTFQEVGGLSGAARDEGGVRKVTPAPYVMGLAKVDGRDVAIGGEDFTVRGGIQLGRRPAQGRPGRLRRGPRVPLQDPAHQPDRRRRRQRDHDRRRGHSILPGVDGFERSVEPARRACPW